MSSAHNLRKLVKAAGPAAIDTRLDGLISTPVTVVQSPGEHSVRFRSNPTASLPTASSALRVRVVVSCITFPIQEVPFRKCLGDDQGAQWVEVLLKRRPQL